MHIIGVAHDGSEQACLAQCLPQGTWGRGIRVALIAGHEPRNRNVVNAVAPRLEPGALLP